MFRGWVLDVEFLEMRRKKYLACRGTSGVADCQKLFWKSQPSSKRGRFALSPFRGDGWDISRHEMFFFFLLSVFHTLWEDVGGTIRYVRRLSKMSGNYRAAPGQRKWARNNWFHRVRDRGPLARPRRRQVAVYEHPEPNVSYGRESGVSPRTLRGTGQDPAGYFSRPQ